jgi:2-polyprenyl-3-methyl-5-hydroxy-6-metoxy-1,4-benzoquinol methylase
MEIKHTFEKYSYPDRNDKCIQKQHSTNKHWNNNGLENKYIKSCIDYLNEDDKNYFLDAGCGEGRLLTKFTRTFKKIIAIDPDIKRLKKAKNKIKSSGKKVNIKFFNMKLESFKSETFFDCILCSHIIQHVHTETIKKIFEQIKSLLKPNGYLILLTTNWPDNKDQYLLTDLCTLEDFVTNKRKFNEVTHNSDKFLPTRNFSENTLLNILKEAGFEIIFLNKYNGYPQIRGDNFIFAKYVNF